VGSPRLKRWVVPYILRLRELCGNGVAVSNWVGESRLKTPDSMLELKLSVGSGPLLGQDLDVETLGPDRYAHFAAQNNVPLVLGLGAAFAAAHA
jgi:hypothetical protein